MDKTKITSFIKGIQNGMSKHSPEILTGIGIAGMITTTILAVKATPKALEAIDEKKQEKPDEKLKPVEIVKVTWKHYIPAAVTCVASTACLIGANKVSMKRITALSTEYKLSETALTEYKDKVIETIGEKKEKVIREKITEDKIEKNPVSKNEVYITGKGKTLFYEPMTSRYFEHDIDDVKRIVNETNEKMLSYDYISLNEFFDELGLKRCSIGDEIGWNIGRDRLIKIDYTPVKTDDDRPCLALDYNVSPRYDYSKLM